MEIKGCRGIESVPSGHKEGAKDAGMREMEAWLVVTARGGAPME